MKTPAEQYLIKRADEMVIGSIFFTSATLFTGLTTLILLAFWGVTNKLWLTSPVWLKLTSDISFLVSGTILAVCLLGTLYTLQRQAHYVRKMADLRIAGEWKRGLDEKRRKVWVKKHKWMRK